MARWRRSARRSSCRSSTKATCREPVGGASSGVGTITRRACLRFYAELREFLPREFRAGTITRSFDVPGSVKDMIEACGVPHTEVELVIVDGHSVDFSHLVHDGEHISVYPMFESFDIAPIAKVRPEPLREVRFVADAHLGRLVRYLRLLGFDTSFKPGWDDPELVRISTGEHRILLTRDVGLLKHRAVAHGSFVRATDVEEQMTEVVRRFHLAERIDPFTRCVACNGTLVPVAKEEIAHRLPPGTRRHVDEFSICSSCGKIYWRGSHYGELQRIVESARRAEDG